MRYTEQPDFLEWFATQDRGSQRYVLQLLQEIIGTEGNKTQSKELIDLLRKMMNGTDDDANVADLLAGVDM